MPSGVGNIPPGRAPWTRAWLNCVGHWTTTRQIRVLSKPFQARATASLRQCMERGKIFTCPEGGGSIYSCYHCHYGWVCFRLCWRIYYHNQIHLIYTKPTSALPHSYSVQSSESPVLWLLHSAFL